VDSYTDRVAFVTGAAGGIGLAIARALGRRGMKLMLADRDADALAAAQSGLAQQGMEVDRVVCDVSSIDSVRQAAKATLARFGKVHFVVNNAGVSLGGATGDIAIEDWAWIVNINLMGVVAGVETFTPLIASHGEGGCILNTASMAGHLAMAGGGPYNATKYAVVGYSETIRQELAPQGIAVSVLCPGWVKTAINGTAKDRPSMQAGAPEREETEQGKKIAAAIDAGLSPDVVADWTLSQIDKGRFYIFTHPELLPFVEGRFSEIKADMEASRQVSELALVHAGRSGEAPLNVLVIGAGFSGVCAAIRLAQNGIGNFAVFDKCDGIGGTWWLNTYPGAACDVPSHFYCYSFEMNPDWSRQFASQSEIQKYIARCAEKYGVRDRIHLGREITSIAFNEETALWVVCFADGSERRARFVINGSGGLHQPKIPDFKGRALFKGPQMHTARWNHGFDPAGKRIAVIGSAASAIQVVPQLAKTAAQVTLFQRTPNYIAPRDDFDYSQQDQEDFRANPAKMDAMRRELFLDRDTRLYPIIINRTIRHIAAQNIKTFMRSKVEDGDLQERLMPDYEVGCKRILISDDFLPALNRDNVRLVTESIDRMTSDGISTSSGEDIGFDAIIYATGFDIEGHVHSLGVTGPGGVTLEQVWKDRTDAYKSVMIPAFPNYFMVTGPNAGVGTTSVVYLIEQSVDWIVEMIKTGGRDRLISVKPDACARFSNDIQARLGDTVWASGCDSWYIAANGRIETLFPGNAQDFADQMSLIEPEDFTFSTIAEPQRGPAPNWAPLRESQAAMPDVRRLDPTIKAILASPDAQNGPKMHLMTPDDARAHYKGMVQQLEGPISVTCAVEAHQMPLNGRTLDFRLYRPNKEKAPGPAMVFFHGGGWVIGDLDTHDNSCRVLANESGVSVLSVDYRRAPEHPFPAPINDGYDAFVWVARNAASLGLDPRRLGIGGDSAGGNMAAVVSHMLRDKGGPPCAWQALIYPSTAANHATPSAGDFAAGYGLDATLQEWFAAHYIPEGVDPSDPRISPLYAADHSGLPPGFIATAGFDPLRDGGADYADKLKSAGVRVRYTEYPDLIHGFKSWAGIVPSAAAALKDMARQIGALAEDTAKSATTEPV
jgi:cation diffusion facilitator CzcD-associated flavoprotein CzcO/acetyl esterase/lipase/NAD(P)-dependent dehydrogenase (short-subunit alcohol dehydrogenase family)